VSRRNDRNARARIATTALPPIDTGADGPAALARRLVQLPTEDAGVYCRQVIEAGPLHGLRLEQRQADAAAQLAQLWRDARPGWVKPGAYGSAGDGERHLTASEEIEAGQAARAYKDALWAIQCGAGVRGVIAVETAVIHHERAHLIAHLLPALSVLADHFGLL
jgi:hypothetical protein